MPEFAPILVSVYDRCEHLKRCVAALLRNPEASDSILYVVSDGPQKPAHYKKILEVREFIQSIRGFKAVKYRFREENWGMRRSGPDAIAWVLSEHDRIIRLEDDVVCSKYFLRFMNDGLRICKQDKRIFAVCGNTYPQFRTPGGYPHEIFLWNALSPWGFSTWKDRWDEFIRNEEEEYKRAADGRVWKGMNEIRSTLQTHKEFLRKRPNNDTKIALHIYLTKLFCVFPVRSLTINGGLDGSGAHCGLGWTHGKQSLIEEPIRITPNIEPSERIAKRLYWAHYSFINHGVGKCLRHLGCFDPFYGLYRKLFCRLRSK